MANTTGEMIRRSIREMAEKFRHKMTPEQYERFARLAGSESLGGVTPLDDIEAMEKEVETTRYVLRLAGEHAIQQAETIDALRAEVERLTLGIKIERGRVEWSDDLAQKLLAENDRLKAEVERLRAALQRVSDFDPDGTRPCEIAREALGLSDPTTAP